MPPPYSGHKLRFDRPNPTLPEPPPTLFDDTPAALVSVPTLGTINETFLAFHAANPWVYVGLVRLARDLVRQGRSKIGIGMLFEVLRWHWYRTTVDAASEFKLNNNYRSRYARMIMAREPDLAGVFDVRALTTP